jgi:hypothetical protein
MSGMASASNRIEPHRDVTRHEAARPDDARVARQAVEMASGSVEVPHFGVELVEVRDELPCDGVRVESQFRDLVQPRVQLVGAGFRARDGAVPAGPPRCQNMNGARSTAASNALSALPRMRKPVLPAAARAS